jgi:hypothetical protein
VVGSQTVSLTPGPSFALNLGCRCPNCQCEGIFDIYVSRPFQRHQEHPNARCFSPCCRALNIRESRRTPNPQLFQVLGFTPTLGQSEVATNWQFDSQPLKVGNHPNFFTCRWRATYYWKIFNEDYNFSSNLILIRGLHVKLWALKIVGDSVVGISGLPLGSLGTKWHFGAHAMVRHKIYYKGEGGGFPQICVVVSFMNPSLHVARPNTKSALTLH